MSFKIGDVLIENQVLLAPMAGVTNAAFFYIAKKYGAGLLSSEMISDKGIIHNNKNTLNLLKFDTSIRPFSLQLFGSKKEELSEAAFKAYEIVKPDIIDINMGCSVPKILRSSSGVSLMNDPDYVYEIVKAVKEKVPCPVTIKIRSGLTHETMNYLDVAKSAEKAGAGAIIFHPRTKSDLFKNKADWTQIKILKDNLKIPVIGSGDIKTPEDAKRMLDETGCDAVMIGRCALGNPFIFEEVNDFLKKGEYREITDQEKFDTIKEHFSYLLKLKDEKAAVLEMRSQAAWYVKGMINSANFKAKLNLVKTKKELLDLFDSYQKEILNY